MGIVHIDTLMQCDLPVLDRGLRWQTTSHFYPLIALFLYLLPNHPLSCQFQIVHKTRQHSSSLRNRWSLQCCTYAACPNLPTCQPWEMSVLNFKHPGQSQFNHGNYIVLSITLPINTIPLPFFITVSNSLLPIFVTYWNFHRRVSITVSRWTSWDIDQGAYVNSRSRETYKLCCGDREVVCVGSLGIMMVSFWKVAQ